jgi:hypothetical protein
VVDRAGYLFTGPSDSDVDAFVELAGQPKRMAIKCIDLIDLLTLAQDPHVLIYWRLHKTLMLPMKLLSKSMLMQSRPTMTW